MNDATTTTAKRPYLLRAFYEWIVDNGMTPHVLVDARSAQVKVPRQFVKDGSIVLNVSMTAANNLMMDNDSVTFSARFGGKAFAIYLPVWSIMAIYSRETQDGISFPPDEYALDGDMEVFQEVRPTPSLAAVAGDDSLDGGDEVTEQDDEPEPPKPTRQRPALRVVK
ncbi:ClpXP protease specificity-enhancing factor [Candidatus Thiothrix anitrata]|jgi:stringent starvation protein B|uniref:ClpXP protease specificity-enhancing factor n=1 Tax=Candidatus Thiothrix anitrata TaxID=2823902 RepID=A0ABX7X7V4_9GAMM|nr:ClpXP protease specificity-enhancing factor [Candidatus Thiothrix anitrata]QTR49785.1 ClpXP protease specificity-enhancing factor [Candidatus Thiothrix anitrata]